MSLLACTGSGSASLDAQGTGGDFRDGDLPPEAAAGGVLEETAEIGSLEGSFEVDALGRFHYDLPLELPPGRSGVAPSLSLHYDSGTGNGILGMGWSIAGLSAITRCHDARDPVGTRDALCLDGQLLVRATQSEWRTEKDSGVRVTRNGCGYRVESKDGLSRIYGCTDSSEGSEFPIPPSDDPDGDFDGGDVNRPTTTWALSRVLDRNGNHWDVEYRNINDVLLGPLRIYYTGNLGTGDTPTKTVHFDYEEDNEPPRFDSFFHASVDNLRLPYLLHRIRITTNGSEKESVYKLRYDGADTWFETNEGLFQSSGRVRLESIERCVRTQEEERCLPRTDFGWRVPRAGFEPPVLTHDYTFLTENYCSPPLVADFDGDGRDDVVDFFREAGCDGFQLLFGADDGFDGDHIISPIGAIESEPPTIVDVDADGTADVVTVQRSDDADDPDLFVVRSQYHRFAPPDGGFHHSEEFDSSWDEVLQVVPADLDSDGLTDLVTCEANREATDCWTHRWERDPGEPYEDTIEPCEVSSLFWYRNNGAGFDLGIRAQVAIGEVSGSHEPGDPLADLEQAVRREHEGDYLSLDNTYIQCLPGPVAGLHANTSDPNKLIDTVGAGPIYWANTTPALFAEPLPGEVGHFFDDAFVEDEERNYGALLKVVDGEFQVVYWDRVSGKPTRETFFRGLWVDPTANGRLQRVNPGGYHIPVYWSNGSHLEDVWVSGLWLSTALDFDDDGDDDLLRLPEPAECDPIQGELTEEYNDSDIDGRTNRRHGRRPCRANWVVTPSENGDFASGTRDSAGIAGYVAPFHGHEQAPNWGAVGDLYPDNIHRHEWERQPIAIGDFDGDGTTDVAATHPDHLNSGMMPWAIYYHRRAMADGTGETMRGQGDLLVSASEGQGKTVRVRYSPTTDADVYRDDGSCGEASICARSPRTVVAEVSASAGNAWNEVEVDTYTYRNARTDHQGRRFLGFEEVQVDSEGPQPTRLITRYDVHSHTYNEPPIDSEGDAVTSFRGFLHTGTVTDQILLARDESLGKLYATWDVVELGVARPDGPFPKRIGDDRAGPGSYIQYPELRSTFEYELDWSNASFPTPQELALEEWFRSTEAEVLEIDGYGNVTRSRETVHGTKLKAPSVTNTVTAYEVDAENWTFFPLSIVTTSEAPNGEAMSRHVANVPERFDGCEACTLGVRLRRSESWATDAPRSTSTTRMVKSRRSPSEVRRLTTPR